MVIGRWKVIGPRISVHTVGLMKFAVGERNVAIRYIYFALGCVI